MAAFPLKNLATQKTTHEDELLAAPGPEGSVAALVEGGGALGTDLAALVRGARNAVLHSLSKHGALLFRGFDVAGANGFESVTRALTESSFSYVGGGSPRSRISGEVFTSTEYPAEATIPLHNEASYFRAMPAFVWFYCGIAPQNQGETPLGDMRLVLKRLDADLVSRFNKNGLMYVTNLHGGRGFGKSWQAAYDTTEPTVVEARIREKGFELEWMPGGNLRVIMRAPVVRQHDLTGQLFWGNQVANWHPATLPEAIASGLKRMYRDPINYPKSVFFDDGSAIPDADIQKIAQVLRESETTFRWRKGDVLLVDNQAIAHGRRPFAGQRQIMVALA